MIKGGPDSPSTSSERERGVSRGERYYCGSITDPMHLLSGEYRQSWNRNSPFWVYFWVVSWTQFWSNKARPVALTSYFCDCHLTTSWAWISEIKLNLFLLATWTRLRGNVPLHMEMYRIEPAYALQLAERETSWPVWWRTDWLNWPL